MSSRIERTSGNPEYDADESLLGKSEDRIEKAADSIARYSLGGNTSFTHQLMHEARTRDAVAPYKIPHDEPGLTERIAGIGRKGTLLEKSRYSEYYDSTKDLKEAKLLGRKEYIRPISRRSIPDSTALARDARITSAGKELSRLSRIQEMYIATRSTMQRTGSQWVTISTGKLDSYGVPYLYRVDENALYAKDSRGTVFKMDSSLKTERISGPDPRKQKRLENIATRVAEIDASQTEGTFVDIPHNTASGQKFTYAKKNGEYYACSTEGEYYKLVGDKSVRVKKPGWVEVENQESQSDLLKIDSIFEKKFRIQKNTINQFTEDMNVFTENLRTIRPEQLLQFRDILIPAMQKKYPKLSDTEATTLLQIVVDEGLPHIETLMKKFLQILETELRALEGKEMDMRDMFQWGVTLFEKHEAELNEDIKRIETIVGPKLLKALERYPDLIEKMGGMEKLREDIISIGNKESVQQQERENVTEWRKTIEKLSKVLNALEIGSLEFTLGTTIPHHLEITSQNRQPRIGRIIALSESEIQVDMSEFAQKIPLNIDKVIDDSGLDALSNKIRNIISSVRTLQFIKGQLYQTDTFEKIRDSLNKKLNTLDIEERLAHMEDMNYWQPLILQWTEKFNEAKRAAIKKKEALSKEYGNTGVDYDIDKYKEVMVISLKGQAGQERMYIQDKAIAFCKSIGLKTEYVNKRAGYIVCSWKESSQELIDILKALDANNQLISTVKPDMGELSPDTAGRDENSVAPKEKVETATLTYRPKFNPEKISNLENKANAVQHNLQYLTPEQLAVIKTAEERGFQIVRIITGGTTNEGSDYIPGVDIVDPNGGSAVELIVPAEKNVSGIPDMHKALNAKLVVKLQELMEDFRSTSSKKESSRVSTLYDLDFDFNDVKYTPSTPKAPKKNTSGSRASLLEQKKPTSVERLEQYAEWKAVEQPKDISKKQFAETLSWYYKMFHNLDLPDDPSALGLIKNSSPGKSTNTFHNQFCDPYVVTSERYKEVLQDDVLQVNHYEREQMRYEMEGGNYYGKPAKPLSLMNLRAEWPREDPTSIELGAFRQVQRQYNMTFDEKDILYVSFLWDGNMQGRMGFAVKKGTDILFLIQAVKGDGQKQESKK